ncbi:MAG: hypothetical protein Q9220_003256 [cf. Caloplaca sp. 1 TL-2023]
MSVQATPLAVHANEPSSRRSSLDVGSDVARFHPDVASYTTNLPFEIQIMDSNGQSQSHSFEVLHAASEVPVGTLNRRAYTRLLDHCPYGEGFITSTCREEVSPQAYLLECSSQHGNSWYFRRCRPDEICIQGIPKQNPSLPDGQLVPPTLRAYCVKEDSFVRLANDQLAHKTIPGMIGEAYHATKGTPMAVEAVLTGPTMNESIFAARLEMSAQTSDTLNGAQAWRSQVGGLAACTQCARIWIAPVPDATQRVVVKAVLGTAASSGLLFLSQIAL